MREKRRKRRLNKKRFLIFLIIIFIIFLISYYVLTMRVTNIKIIGTNLISDNEIIEVSNLKNYPKLFSIPSFTIASKIKTLDLVNDVKVTKNLYGRVTIKVDEAKILFYNKNNDKLVLSNEKEIDDNNKYLGIPTLINYVPKEIYSDLINGFKLIDNDVLRIISEIEYAPSKTINGETIDDYRFMLRMNDSNTAEEHGAQQLCNNSFGTLSKLSIIFCNLIS